MSHPIALPAQRPPSVAATPCEPMRAAPVPTAEPLTPAAPDAWAPAVHANNTPPAATNVGGVPAGVVDQRLQLRANAFVWPDFRAPAGTVVVVGPGGVRSSFTVVRSLSSGHAGSTLLGKASDGMPVVIKVPHDGAAIFDVRMNTEAEAYRALAPCEQLPRFYGCGRDELGRKALVVEFVDGGPLDCTPATSANPTKAVRIAMQVLRAVRALNAVGRRHADLCPGNVFIKGDASNTVKVIDLGMAAKITDDYEWGGPKYYAPEQTQGLPSLGRVNADVYSVGALLQKLLGGAELTRNGMPLADVVARALDPDPATRYQTSQELLDALRIFAS